MKKKITFEAGMAELEAIVQSLESGQMPLEESFKAYERAVEIKDALGKLLDEGDRRIRVLTQGGETALDGEEDA